MPTRYYAAVNCPACGTRFQTPIEQILDVRVDAEAKGRLLSGMVNVAVCPSCGTGGKLNVPFLYHDPGHEMALLYLPMELGKTEVERQQFAGRLTRELMDSLPLEERKGYLLQPETFFNLDTLIRRVLEADGVTEADLERNRQQQELVGELLQAPQEEWESKLQEKGDLVDENLFAFLDYTLRLAAASNSQADIARVQALYQYLVKHHPVGQQLAQRTEVIQKFAADPNRWTLLEAVLAAPDEETLAILLQAGVNLMDYAFFQGLLQRIEGAETPAEKERLTALRRRLLELREELMQAGKDAVEARIAFLERLVNSEDPLKMARSHLSELDELFFAVLRDQMEQAAQTGNQELLQALQGIGQVVERVAEETLPPEVALARRLLAAASEEQLNQLLDQNRGLLREPFFQLLEALEANSREQGEPEVAARLAEVRARAQAFVAPTPASTTAPTAPTTPPPAPAPLHPGEEQRPSGLIIAKK